MKHNNDSEAWLKGYNQLKQECGRPPTKTEWGAYMDCTRERARQVANLLKVETTDGWRLPAQMNHQRVRAAYQAAPQEYNGKPKTSSVAEGLPISMATVRKHLRKMQLATAYPTIKTEEYEECRRVHADLTQSLGRPPSISEVAKRMGIFKSRSTLMMKNMNLPRIKHRTGPKYITYGLYLERYILLRKQLGRLPAMRELAEVMGVNHTRIMQVRDHMGLEMADGRRIRFLKEKT